MEDCDGGEWVLVQRPTERDSWKPSNLLGSEASSKPLKVIFDGPAKHWTDAIPIGNGRLGAMVWGGVASETLNLNEDTLWTGHPGNYTNADAPETLSEVRKLVDNGKYAEATEAAVKLLGDLSEVYQLIGDLKIDFDESHFNYAPESYKRELDLDTATTKIVYSVGDIEFTREHFASNPSQVIAMKISASRTSCLSFTVSLDSVLDHSSYANNENQIIMKGSCPGKRIPPTSNNDSNKGIAFSAIVDVQIGGENGKIHVLDDRKLKVENSDWAVLLVVASSAFDGPFTEPSDSTKDPTLDSMSMLKSVKKFSYSNLYVRHLEDYQNLFCRVLLQLSKSSKSVKEDGNMEGKKIASARTCKNLSAREIEDDKLPTVERIRSFQTDEDPGLIELLFQFGRYLLISCSRPGTQVANLQGIWNRDIEPAWECTPHLNINLEMNYWLSLPCNLSECQEPLFDYLSNLSLNGSKTAKVNYQVDGWLVHHVTDIWAKSDALHGKPVWALWPMGGAWLSTHLWEHYTFNMDKEFLKNKAYPLLEGCAVFLLEWLIEGRGAYLETNPSTSPEHTFVAPDGKPASVSYSSTMDISIIKEVFTAIVSAAQVLGKSEDDLIQKVLEAQAKLPPTRIARDGSIMEWVQDFEDPEPHHRHLSHLFGLFPGHSISIDRTPDLCKAADYTLYKRGEEGPGWSTAWKIALWSRLHNSENAYRMVKHLFHLVDPDHEISFEGGLYSNLFTAHPPFQIDANFGFTAAIAEMLVQSTMKDLYLLPALPRDKWPTGCVKGLKARGGLTVNMCWGEGYLQEVGLCTEAQNSVIQLHYRGIVVPVKLCPGRVYTFNRQLKCLRTCTLSS